jgi:hypothetical protein
MRAKTIELAKVFGCYLFVGGIAGAAHAQERSATAPVPTLGVAPQAAAMPRLEFAFEFRVTLAPPVVLGDTAFGHRQYIPITGGRIAGPKLTGEVLSGGWDYQLGLADGCNMLAADYFIRARDGAVIHVVNGGLACSASRPGGERSFFTPRFEAPHGSNEWLTRATFIATLELEQAPGKTPDAPRTLEAVRLKFYQVR